MEHKDFEYELTDSSFLERRRDDIFITIYPYTWLYTFSTNDECLVKVASILNIKDKYDESEYTSIYKVNQNDFLSKKYELISELMIDNMRYHSKIINEKLDLDLVTPPDWKNVLEFVNRSY